MTVNPNGYDYQPAPQEDWKYLPIEQAAPGDTIEDPANQASWTIDTLTRHKDSNAYAFSAGQGIFIREYVLADQKFWVLRRRDDKTSAS